ATEQAEKTIITRYVGKEADSKPAIIDADNPYEVDGDVPAADNVQESDERQNARAIPASEKADEGGDQNWETSGAEEIEQTEAAVETNNEVEEIQPAASMGPGEIIDPQDKSEPETARDLEEPKDRARNMDPAQQRVNVVFEQAENIKQSDLRDQAFLDLVEYATRKGMFEDAKIAAAKINQIELRDTARSRIAMGLARYGQSDEAFALIEEVEVDALRDIMRLKVIEALLGNDQRR
ncbi:MAG: hypothetical protein HKN36_01805, partial [Hellea sp.]|nr:hypothetical protein [Hellea sp.]